MAGYTDFGAPKRPKKKDSGKPGALSVKVKGKPADVHRVLGAMKGAGDLMKPPGPRGPKMPYKIPGSKSLTGRKALPSRGAGDNPVPLKGGVQPVISMSRTTVYKAPRKAKMASKSPDAPAKLKRPPKVTGKLRGKGPLNPNMLLDIRLPQAPPKSAGRRGEVPDRLEVPPEAEPKKAPPAKLHLMKLPRASKMGESEPTPPKGRAAMRPEETEDTAMQAGRR